MVRAQDDADALPIAPRLASSPLCRMLTFARFLLNPLDVCSPCQAYESDLCCRQMTFPCSDRRLPSTAPPVAPSRRHRLHPTQLDERSGRVR